MVHQPFVMSLRLWILEEAACLLGVGCRGVVSAGVLANVLLGILGSGICPYLVPMVDAVGTLILVDMVDVILVVLAMPLLAHFLHRLMAT